MGFYQFLILARCFKAEAHVTIPIPLGFVYNSLWIKFGSSSLALWNKETYPWLGYDKHCHFLPLSSVDHNQPLEW